jgi:hypothetical protein
MSRMIYDYTKEVLERVFQPELLLKSLKKQLEIYYPTKLTI